MIQRREHFRFALKPADAIRIARELVRQDFDRNLALQFRIASAIHLAHAAFAEQCDNLM